MIEPASHLAISYYRYGEPLDVLRLTRKRSALPGRGQLAVRMLARPINPSDLIPVRGAYAHRIALPAIAGYEGVGIVEAVGEDVPSSWLGMRVLPLRGEGTWQDVVLSPACWAVRIPSLLSDEEACQLYINPVTAWLLLTELLRLAPGALLLLNAGASSFARTAAQLARELGIRLVCILRGSEADEQTMDEQAGHKLKLREQELLQLGAWQTIISGDDLELEQELCNWNGGLGADAAIDCVGGAEAARLLSYVRCGGQAVSIGLLSGKPFTGYAEAQRRRLHYSSFHLRHWLATVSPAEWQLVFARLNELICSGRLVLPAVAASYPLSCFQDALREQAQQGRAGKLLLT